MIHKLIQSVSSVVSLFLSLIVYVDELVHYDTFLLRDIFWLRLSRLTAFGSIPKVRLGNLKLRLVLIDRFLKPLANI